MITPQRINLSWFFRFKFLLSFGLLAWIITACTADTVTLAGSTPTNSDARKQELIQLMRGLKLEPAAGSTNPLCKAFLEDFRQQKTIEHIDPSIQTDNYEDPRLTPYKSRCPKLDFHKTLEPVGAAPHKAPLPPGEEINEDNYNVYLDTRNLRLYELEMDDNPANGKEIVFYGEAPKIVRSGGVPFPDGPIHNMHRGRYRVIGLDRCSDLGGMGVSELWTPSRIESHGVIRYRGKNALYDLTVYPAGKYADGSPHGQNASLRLNYWYKGHGDTYGVRQACRFETPRK